MSFIVWTDPYAGLAASIVTSNVLDATDAFDISLSWHTASGTSSVFSYQVSGQSTKPTGATGDEAYWSHWTLIVPPSGASSRVPPDGYPWHRILRTVSGGSFVMNWNKTQRER